MLQRLKDRIDLPYMMGSFASGTTASLVVKKKLKNYVSDLKTDFDVHGV